MEPQVQIKLKYRLAYVLCYYLRDYEQAHKVLKHLKKYCNTWERVDLFKEADELHMRVSELQNNYRGKLAMKQVVDEAGNNKSIGEYMGSKVGIREG